MLDDEALMELDIGDTNQGKVLVCAGDRSDIQAVPWLSEILDAYRDLEDLAEGNSRLLGYPDACAFLEDSAIDFDIQLMDAAPCSSYGVYGWLATSKENQVKAELRRKLDTIRKRVSKTARLDDNSTAMRKGVEASLDLKAELNQAIEVAKTDPEVLREISKSCANFMSEVRASRASECGPLKYEGGAQVSVILRYCGVPLPLDSPWAACIRELIASGIKVIPYEKTTFNITPLSGSKYLYKFDSAAQTWAKMWCFTPSLPYSKTELTAADKILLNQYARGRI